jgi:hypothetical protein
MLRWNFPATSVPRCWTRSDPEIRSAVENLLARDGAGILDRPAWELATTLLDSPTAQIELGALLGPYRVESESALAGWARCIEPQMHG